MVTALVLVICVVIVVTVFVNAELRDALAGRYKTVEFYDHRPRPLLTVVVTERPHLYDWAVDDDFIHLR